MNSKNFLEKYGGNMLLRNKLLLLVLFFFYSINGFTQSVENQDTTTENYNQAVQFYILDELIVGYKYLFTEESAIRLIVNATGLFKNDDYDDVKYFERETDTTVYLENRESTNSNQYFEIQLQYLYYFKVHNIFQIYLGTGPFVSYNFTQHEDWNETYYPSEDKWYNRYYKSNESIWSLGVSAVIGLEFTVYKNVSLFAEYEAALSIGWQNEDYYSSSSSYITENRNHDTWGYELKGIRIGATIYF